MKKSLKNQMVCLILGLLGFVFLCNWAMNNFFLERYYVAKKEKVLRSVYGRMNHIEDEEQYLDESFVIELSDVCTRYNMSAIVVTENFDTMYGLGSTKLKELRGRLWGYMMGVDTSETDILEETDEYVVQKTKDFKTGVEYLEMWGVFNTGCYFLVRIPMESIRDSVRTANEFLGYFLVISLFVSLLVIPWIVRKVTNPLQELTELSKRMADLDFDVRYTSGGKNEIGQLGECFNRMSEILEETISELKTANNQLQSDIEEKIQIDEMRKEFLSNVSHELKTPIALIQGYAEGLKECINDDAESRDFYCDVIMDEAAKMNHMVKQLLSLNQLESGKDAVTFERFDLVKLARGIVQSSALLAEQKGAHILFEETQPCMVWADEFKTEEVVTNFVSNALNHVDFEKMIEIKIQKAESKVRLSVFNTGVPIPEEDLDKIWIKFYKVDKARTREYGGSGIGLSIVKAIMDSMHQKFGVKNYENGVEFWFELDGEGKEVQHE